MKRSVILTVAAAVILAIVAAAMLLPGGGDSGATPRPRGFARVEPYPDSTVAVELPEVTFNVNALAEQTRERPNWLTASYPRYNASLYITSEVFADPDSLRRALANRHERISLNLAGRRAEVEDFTNDAGIRILLTRSLEPAPVPFQFIAADGSGLFVSGAVTMTGTVEPADSVAPALADLYTQLSAILRSIERR